MKPGGVHTVRGKGEPCLESCLDRMGMHGWMLLNRLDFLTSGLVLAAASSEEGARYSAWQDAGDVRKWYLALAHGGIARDFSVRGRILDSKRRVVQVLEELVNYLKVRDRQRLENAARELIVYFNSMAQKARLGNRGGGTIGCSSADEATIAKGECKLSHWQIAGLPPTDSGNRSGNRRGGWAERVRGQEPRREIGRASCRERV